MSDYALLYQMVKEKGLFEKDIKPYLAELGLAFGLYTVMIAIIIFSPSGLLCLFVTAGIFSLGQVRIGLLGHDATHYQIFDSKKLNHLAAFIMWNLGLGLSHLWWEHQHGLHHDHPNNIDLDPDMDRPFLAYSPEQLKNKGPIQKLLIKHQAYLYFLFMMLGLLVSRFYNIHFLVKNKNIKYRLLEIVGITTHTLIYFILIISVFGLRNGIIFTATYHAIAGLLFGLLFAPNHKGMPTIKANTVIDPLQAQIITSRNIKSNTLTNFLYGGLNYQIEHHLFRNMPRHKLRTARSIIKPFRNNNDIYYHETGICQSFKEIFSGLKIIDN